MEIQIVVLCLLIPGENNGWDIYKSYIRDSVNPKIKEIAMEEGLCLIDLYTALQRNPTVWLMGDSVHPTKAGGAIIASKVKQILTKSKPKIKSSKGVLTAPFSDSYQWYCDRVMIPVADGGCQRSYKPIKSGLYKVSIKLSKSNDSRIVSQDFLIDSLGK